MNLPPVPKERNQAFLPVSPNRGHKGKREGWGFKKLLAVKHKKWVRLFIVWFYFHHLDILYIWSWIFCIVWGRGCFLYFNLRISKWPSCVFLKESSFLHWSAVPHCHRSNICLFIGLFLYSLLLCHFVYSCTSITFSNSLQFSRSLCLTPCHPMNHSRPGLPVHHQLPEFTQTHVHWAGDAIQPSHPLSSPSPPALNLSQHQGLFQWVFGKDSPVLPIRWPKYWSFSFGIRPSNENPGPISFRMDWLDFLAVQGTLKSLLQHHSS